MKLARLFSVLLPDENQTRLLRACLQEKPFGREAWEMWTKDVGDYKGFFIKDRMGLKRLIPLLYQNLVDNQAALDIHTSGFLESALMREEIHSESHRRLCQRVFAVLAEAGAEGIMLRGMALADSCYESWLLRYCHDIHLLVEEENQGRAVTALKKDGFLMKAESWEGLSSDTVVLEHNSGLLIHLQREMFAVPFYEPPMDVLRVRARSREVAGSEVLVLSPADHLLHVLGHATTSRSRDTLRWVCDSWFVIKNVPDLDWDAFTEITIHSRLALPLWVMLSYLDREMGVEFPEEVLRALSSQAKKTRAAGVETAISCARLGSRGGYKNIFKHADSCHVRLFLIRWILFPSPDYMRRKYAIDPLWKLPYYYLYRLSRFLGEWFPKRG